MATDEKLKAAIADFLKIKEERLTPETVLTDLVRESFVLVEMVMFLQDEFSVRVVQDDLKTVQTVGHLLQLFKTKSQQ